MNGDIKSLSFIAAGERHPGFSRKIDVKNRVAMVAIKVAMLLHVGTKAGRTPFQGNLPDDPAFHQGIEAIVNGGHRDVGHVPLCPHENLFGRGVIPLFEQDLVYLLALGCETETAGSKQLI